MAERCRVDPQVGGSSGRTGARDGRYWEHDARVEGHFIDVTGQQNRVWIDLSALLLRVTGTFCYSNHVYLRRNQPLEQIKHAATMLLLGGKKAIQMLLMRKKKKVPVHRYGHRKDDITDHWIKLVCVEQHRLHGLIKAFFLEIKSQHTLFGLVLCFHHFNLIITPRGEWWNLFGYMQWSTEVDGWQLKLY